MPTDETRMKTMDDQKLMEMAYRRCPANEITKRCKNHTVPAPMLCSSYSNSIFTNNTTPILPSKQTTLILSLTHKVTVKHPSKRKNSATNQQHGYLSMTKPASSTPKRILRGWAQKNVNCRSSSSIPAVWSAGPVIVAGVLLLLAGRTPVAAQYTEAGAWEGLENNTAVNVSSQLATTAFLPCAVRMIGDKQISWIRKRDWHVLTSGLKTFTNDARFSVTHKDGADDWTLTIKFLQKRDNGTYECQISTASGIVSQFVHLHVIIPEAFILGNSEYHVQTGSSINLFCIIEQSPIPPQFVSWKHNERLLNYDKHRGGVSVQTEHGAKTSSRLLISGATIADSGNYTCGAPNTESATVHVFVSQGDKTAAIQRRTSAAPGLLGSSPIFLAALSLVFSLEIVAYLQHLVLL